MIKNLMKMSRMKKERIESAKIRIMRARRLVLKDYRKTSIYYSFIKALF